MALEIQHYKINGKNHWAHLNGAALSFALFTGMTLFAISQYKEDVLFAVLFFGSFFIAQLAPQLFIHFHYLNTNKEDSLLYDTLFKEFIFNHRTKQIKFSLDDVTRITLNKSFALHKRNAQFLFWDSYNHATILLKDGSQIIVTSLLVGGEITFPVEESKKVIRLNLFRWVNGPSFKAGV